MQNFCLSIIKNIDNYNAYIVCYMIRLFNLMQYIVKLLVVSIIIHDDVYNIFDF